MAVLLWLIVRVRQPTEGYVDVSVLPTLDSSLVLLGEPPRVRALIVARGADLMKLYATPPVVRRAVSGEVPDTLVLDLTPGDVRLPADLGDAARVLDVQPRSVVLRFETRSTRRVAVANEGRVLVHGGAGSPAAAVRFDPDWVRVTGPRALVRGLRGVRPVSLAIAAGDTLVHLADLDTAGLGVVVHPAQVKVRVAPAPAVAP